MASVQVIECPCLTGSPVEFDSEEGRGQRRRCVRHYRALSRVQIPLALMAVLSGATSIGLAIPNPSYFYMTCFPLTSGMLLLIAGLFARRVGRADLDHEVPTNIKRGVMAHYTLCLTGLTFSCLATAFAAAGLVSCFGEDAACRPVRDVKLTFTLADVALGTLLFPTCVAAVVLFCAHARGLGMVEDNVQSLRNEVTLLKYQVTAITQGQAQGQLQVQGYGGVDGIPGTAPPPPPSYAEVQNEKSGGEAGLVGPAYKEPL